MFNFLTGGILVMSKGRVKWFSDRKSYGFIERDGDKDVFVHSSDLVGVYTLSEGDEVNFDVVQGEKGLKAENVTKVE